MSPRKALIVGILALLGVSATLAILALSDGRPDERRFGTFYEGPANPLGL